MDVGKACRRARDGRSEHLAATRRLASAGPARPQRHPGSYRSACSGMTSRSLSQASATVTSRLFSATQGSCSSTGAEYAESLGGRRRCSPARRTLTCDCSRDSTRRHPRSRATKGIARGTGTGYARCTGMDTEQWAKTLAPRASLRRSLGCPAPRTASRGLLRAPRCWTCLRIPRHRDRVALVEASENTQLEQSGLPSASPSSSSGRWLPATPLPRYPATPLRGADEAT
jgi:hypothetical protein